MSETNQYCTFFADHFHFAIDVDHVQEVLQPMPVTHVPLASDVIDGLVNLRGQIVTAIDLRTRLELPRREPSTPSVSLIVRTKSGLMSVRTDRLGDVLDSESIMLSRSSATDGLTSASDLDAAKEAPLFQLEPLPDTVQGPVREVTRGIIQLETSLLLVLDPEQLLTADVSLDASDTDR